MSSSVPSDQFSLAPPSPVEDPLPVGDDVDVGDDVEIGDDVESDDEMSDEEEMSDDEDEFEEDPMDEDQEFFPRRLPRLFLTSRTSQIRQMHWVMHSSQRSRRRLRLESRPPFCVFRLQSFELSYVI